MKAKEKKQSMGRRKIEIKKIEKQSSLMVAFSKRRTGLFNKAAQLSALCGADVAVLVKSPTAGKFHAFGAPSFDAVIDHFLLQNKSSGTFSVLDTNSSTRSNHAAAHDQLESEKGEEEKVVMEEQEESTSSRFWWDGVAVDELGLHELEEYITALEALMKNVATRADEMAMASASSSNFLESVDSVDPLGDLAIDYSGIDFDSEFDSEVFGYTN